MSEAGYDIPVVLIVFNRPKLAVRQFEVLKRVRPRKLYIVADAPRPKVEADAEKVAAVRRIFEEIPWECEKIEIYAQNNMGCDRRVVSGLNEVFEKEDEAVVLEDDCLPHLSFFSFCREMLLKYRDNSEIMYVSGSKWVQDYKMPYSYGFSYNTGTWGWATWKRAWKEWHWDRQEWDEKKQDWLTGIYSDRYRKNWIRDMEKYFTTDSIPWDYVWRFCVGRRLSIFPSVNLIENVGFGEDATHTTEVMDGYRGGTSDIGDIKHPPMPEADLEYPKRVEKQYRNTLYRRIKRRIFMIVRKQKG